MPDSSGLDTALREAAALVDEGRTVDAFERLRGEENEHPDDPLLLCWLGTLARDVGQDGLAYDYFRHCLAGEPMDPTILATAGHGVAGLDDPAAEPALRMAAITAPELPIARLHYGAYLAREGMFEEALAELEAARDLQPDDPIVHMELATAYLLHGRSEPGIEELNAAVERDPDNSWIQALHAMALWESGHEEEGAEALHRVASVRDHDPELQLFCALALAGQGWEDEAWTALARVDAAADPPPASMSREVEERIEAGPDSATRFLRRQLSVTVLRERLLQRP